MEYVEFVRVRRAFVIYAAIAAVAMLSAAGSIAFASLAHGHGLVTITVGSDASSDQTTYQSLRTIANSMQVPLGLLLGIAGYCAVVFGTVLASSLNRQNAGAEFAFVKPLSRDALALRYVAIDIVGIVAAYAYALVVIELLPLAAVHALGRVRFDGQALWIGALGLGIAFMWYGILQAITATYKGRGGTIVGFSWGAFALMVGAPSLTFLGPAFGAIVYVLNLFNPIAYFSGLLSHNGAPTAVSILGLALEARVCIAWAIAWIAIAIAVTSWKRVEV